MGKIKLLPKIRRKANQAGKRQQSKLRVHDNYHGSARCDTSTRRGDSRLLHTGSHNHDEPEEYYTVSGHVDFSRHQHTEEAALEADYYD